MVRKIACCSRRVFLYLYKGYEIKVKTQEKKTFFGDMDCCCRDCDCSSFSVLSPPKTERRASHEGVLRYMKEHPEAECIVGIHGGWYDLTSFCRRHPGGSVVLNRCHLQDATEPFKAFHGRNVLRGWTPIASYTPREDPASKVFTDLHDAFQREGFFQTSFCWYAAKFAFTFLLLVAVGVILSFPTDSFWFNNVKPSEQLSSVSFVFPSVNVTSASRYAFTSFSSDPYSFFQNSEMYRALLGGLFLGLFWQQCGFLMHDLMHNELTHKRRVDQPLGFLFGSILLGVSAHWWRDEHFEHHAFTNTVMLRPPSIQAEEGSKTPRGSCWESKLECLSTKPILSRPLYVDPQMQEEVWAQNPKLFGLYLYPAPSSIPFCSFVNLCFHRLQQLCISYQNILWVFFCVFAGRPAIVVNGFYKERRWFEILGLSCHTFLIYCLMQWAFPNWTWRFLFYAVAAIYEGVLHVQLLVSHYAKPWVELNALFSSVGWYRAQVICNMNIRNPVWLDWFHGGLNFHIEHHLFPLMPRHRFREASVRVRKACEELGLPYDEVGWFQGIFRTIRHLSHVANLYKT